MPSAAPTDEFEVEDRYDLERLLGTLLATAAANGVRVEGGWAIQTVESLPDWDVHVTRFESTGSDAGAGPDFGD